MKLLLKSSLLAIQIITAGNLFASPVGPHAVRVWTGGGRFSVVYDHAEHSQDCSFVTVQLVESLERVQLSTRYNCEDDEDQEFVPLTLERQGTRLYYGKDLVGTIESHQMNLELKVGRQVEHYSLRFEDGILDFLHSSDLGTPGIGILKAELNQK
jgi:hypothetical protein